MSDEMKITSIQLDDDIDDEPKREVNFGGGLELLYNVENRHKSNGSLHNKNINELEDELKILEIPINNPINNPTNIEDDIQIPINNISIGESTASTESTMPRDEPPIQKTWDGYSTMNNINISDTKDYIDTKHQSAEELLREKFIFLRKLEELEKKGVNLTKTYDMNSSIDEMKGEYESIVEEKTKSNSVKFQGNMLMACINGIEFLNNSFDPFDVKLDGWGEQVGENLSDYDDIFGELYDKYKSKAKMAPELKLLFQLGGSAIMLHMTNTMFKSAIPGVDDVMRQNPDLMKQFQSAAVNSMNTQSPGLSNFMSSNGPTGNNNSNVGPPPPMNTQYVPNNTNTRNDYDNRPDLNTAMHNTINNEKRPEMKGPGDIDDILSGLKSKSMSNATNNIKTIIPDDDSSTISIDDMKRMTSLNIPKRTNKKRKDKNVISLTEI
jgi:hypothetical protein